MIEDEVGAGEANGAVGVEVVEDANDVNHDVDAVADDVVDDDDVVGDDDVDDVDDGDGVVGDDDDVDNTDEYLMCWSCW